MEIKKIEKSDFVMFPRMQHRGLQFRHVERDAYRNHWCEYIEGDLSFLCVIAGFNAEELTPKYPDFISERVYALSDATRWWHEYGKEALLLKDV